MIEEIIKELSNKGIALKAQEDGVYYFAGMQNDYKAVFNQSEYVDFSPEDTSDLEFAVNDIVSQMSLRRTEWEQVGLSKADPIEAETFVAMKTGERGGKHVLINGTWYYASKEV